MEFDFIWTLEELTKEIRNEGRKEEWEGRKEEGKKEKEKREGRRERETSKCCQIS